ncbi:UNVERIFIED_CONTAM: putative mitochondrial protein [Sesamum latifolium]|uniref:Mitochondrial protein n=1 Tax=Sesamum latifolium TaxID=2727402 RepID=A0AAW2VV66_9LAMI
MAGILGVVVLGKHEKYLGLPLAIGRSMKVLITGMKDRIWAKLNNWATKKHSEAGRTILIKTVIQAIPTYVMGCFRIPNIYLNEIESLMENYFWRGGSEHKIHWLAWGNICQDKEGGLSFQRLREQNDAMLAKQSWKVASRPQMLLHQLLWQCNFPDTNYFAAKMVHSASYLAIFASGAGRGHGRDSMTNRGWFIGPDHRSPLALATSVLPGYCPPLSLPAEARVADLIHLD